MRTGRRRERRSEEPSVFREESMITRKTRCRRVFSVVDIHMGRWLEIGGHVGGEGDAVYIVGGDKTGIGIRNVNNRIKIYFGEEYGIQIYSELDEGTRVTITMPKIGEGGYEER